MRTDGTQKCGQTRLQLKLTMADRQPLPHAFTRENNPKRSGAADEELAEKPLAIRFYAVDDEELRQMPNKSEVIRNIVRDHLRETKTDG